MKLEFIIKDAARRKCYKRRVESMKKKLDELCTLCGVEACAIVKSPDEAEAEVWPDSLGVKKALSRFLRLPIHRRLTHMVSLERYIKDRIKKADKDLKKQNKKNREKQLKELMYQCLIDETQLAKFNMTNLDELGLLVDQNISDIDSRIESLKKAALEGPSSSSLPEHMVASCSNTSNHTMAREEPGHERSLEKQPMVGNPGYDDDEMQRSASFMDLLMGSD
uniref:agamous-like MADS-box protein AGL80 n=1 Tax=Erigeron canadensis TaxID=72917 RepID=UPI001CB89892|nr:agamous-like MADS-box protein AGL80 [Erigeron canadensis]